MYCIFNFKDDSYRFDIIDFEMTYLYSDPSVLKIHGFCNDVIYNELNSIRNLMFNEYFKDYKKHCSDIKLIYNKGTYIYKNFYINEIENEYNKNKITIEIAYDYAIFHEEKEIILRKEKIKKIKKLIHEK